MRCRRPPFTTRSAATWWVASPQARSSPSRRLRIDVTRIPAFSSASTWPRCRRACRARRDAAKFAARPSIIAPGKHAMTISRRAFLSASAAWTLAPILSVPASAAALPRDADIVVIGAGAAGIAAARRIQAAGRKVIVIEASGQIGGRCMTDATTFDAPFDRGGRWLHTPETNVVGKLARPVGIDVAPSPPSQKLRIGRRNARASETEELLAALVRANRAIDDGARRADISCAAVLPKDLGDWASTIDYLLGPYATGKDLKDLSTVDLSRAQDRAIDVTTRQGLGVLMARLGESVPVALSTPVTRVTWSGRDIGVETPAGRIAARAVIL